MSLLPIIPEISLLLGSFTILIFQAFLGKKLQNSKRISFIIAIIFSAISLFFIINNYNNPIIAKGGSLFNGSFSFNQYLFLVKIALYILLILFIFSISHYIENIKYGSEFLALSLLSLVGSSLFISSNNLMTFYMSLELQTFPLYVMAAFNRKSHQASESALKYFILSAVASGILLFGISIIYGFSGAINFDVLINRANFATGTSMMVLLGFILVISAMLFKIAAAPFHIWSPDVYQGAPTAATSFFAAIAKFASVIAIIEIFRFLAITWKNIDQIFIFTAILSLIIGSLGAIKQNNIKRLFAYSSIGHVGFILSALAIFHPLYSFAGLTIYIIIYSFASIGIFAFLLSLYHSGKGNIDDINNKKYDINSLAGIAKSNPILAASVTILIFSFAGIPPMSGFFSKFYVLFAIVRSENYILALIAITSAVISSFYYLRIIKIMYFDKRSEKSEISIIRCNSNIILIICALLALTAPLYFSYFLNLVESNIVHIFRYGG
ncbi:NADH-quinone oxidoreductase subunit N [Rickettsiales bacterium]|nr:NADH-quinone oxidoreductase subunit N [Rickettsiales bacterium]